MFEVTGGKIQKAQRFVFYGSEGIGKSTFASKLPGVVFIDTEGSTNQLDVKRLPTPTSWTMLMQEVEFVKNNPRQFQSLVIDTADWAEKMCIDETCATLNVKGIEDLGYGKGYTYVYEQFGKLLNLATDVCNAGVNVGFTAHAFLRKFEQPDEMGAYDRYELKLSKKVAPMIKEWADLVLFMNYKTIVVQDANKTKKGQGGKRVMYAAHHPCWDAKNRHGLPDEMDMDFNLVKHIFGVDISKMERTTHTTEESLAVAPPTTPPPVETKNEQPEINYDGCPQPLIDLMKIDNVHPVELAGVVAQCGFYPAGTPIKAYDPAFISGMLIPEWGKVLPHIKKNRENVPF